MPVELMERRLTDLVGLDGDGLMLQDRMLARSASDVLSVLNHKHGYLKLSDFSKAGQA